MKMENLRRFAAPAVVAAFSFAGTAHAAAIDVADVVTEITSQVSSITAVGGAVFGVLVAAAAFKWIKRVL